MTSRTAAPLKAPRHLSASDAPADLPEPHKYSIFDRKPGWHFSVMLVLEVVFLFIAVPALGAGDAGPTVVTSLQLVIAAIAIALLAKSPWLRVALASSFGLTLLARFLPGLLPQTTTLAMVFIYNFLVTGATAWAVLGPGEVNHHRIAGAVFIYLNIALLFGVAYSALSLAMPDALTGLPNGAPGHAARIIHFSFATLTAIGDSAVAPHAPFARSLADLETVTGQLFPAILLSRLVGLHLARRVHSPDAA